MLIAIGALQLSCAVSDRPAGDTVGTNEVQFYNAADPGPWESKAAEHDIEITVTRVNESKILDVQVPFAKNREKKHYIEAIVILDVNRNELKKKSFDRKRGEAGAKFEFPENFTDPVYVVVKCNLHDMWEKVVDWSE
jgi:desulfoferrodoxin (superoxide reductase-like protein)